MMMMPTRTARRYVRALSRNGLIVAAVYGKDVGRRVFARWRNIRGSLRSFGGMARPQKAKPRPLNAQSFEFLCRGRARRDVGHRGAVNSMDEPSHE